MQAIYNRSKKINAIGKSKLDWKGFVKQEGIEEKLKYNRKGGVIQNMKFIKNTKWLSDQIIPYPDNYECNWL